MVGSIVLLSSPVSTVLMCDYCKELPKELCVL
jgi:hypothetical protein